MTTDITEAQLQLVQRSVPIISNEPAKFARRFYARLFTVAPETRSLFPDDMAEQRTKLVDELVFLAGAADDLESFVGRAAHLGDRHRDYGVDESHYALLEGVLLGTLAEAAGAQWDDELRQAWQSLYRHIAAAMRDTVG